MLDTLTKLVVKNPKERITQQLFLQSQIFQIHSTKKIETIKEEKQKINYKKFNDNLEKLNQNVKDVKDEVLVVKQTVNEVNQNVNLVKENVEALLPAIQKNLLKLLASDGVPSKFIMVPFLHSHHGATKMFFTRYQLHFICVEDGQADQRWVCII
jgi:esterase/lipase